MRSLVTLFIVWLASHAVVSQAQSLVAETAALSPQEQLRKFHLPPGFEIQLVAAEPEIHKPMNLKFDARGRLWVTHSVEYPFPAASEEEARDSISVLSDFAPDGRARTAEQFADHVNVPIGVLPLNDGSAIAWSIPSVYRFADSNGDGVADRKSVLLGPFGIVDVHGNQNSFTRWIDGWVYANHGFSNDSHVKIAGQGDEVLHLNSGNTYRFRPDGSAIEHFSWGQVNPFGLSFDALGNLYSADCHSSAVTMLLRGGYYQSFGKPHDGLDFAPVMTNLDHGGTGIAGVVYSSAPEFPAEYRDVLFVGNVITNRVHCDRLKWSGSTPVVVNVQDFLTCDDPWFRPVDIQIGPDGALYIADFYNCIIGHYEVPLNHPKRDRERGRIWRVVYKGDQGRDSPAAITQSADLTQYDARELFAALGHPSLAVRVLATNLLVDRFPEPAAEMAKALLSDAVAQRSDGSGAQASHAIWVLQRTAGISEDVAQRLVQSNASRDVMLHLIKALGETVQWSPWQFDVARAALSHDDAFVRRAAADALARHAHPENLAPLLRLLNSTDSQDTQLVHATRIAIRDQLTDSRMADALLTLPLLPAEREQLVAFAAAAPQGPAAVLIFQAALDGNVSDEALLNALPTAARFVDDDRIAAMTIHVQKRFASQAPSQFAALKALAEASTQRGRPLSDKLRSKLAMSIESALAGDGELDWRHAPHGGDLSAAGGWKRRTGISKAGDAVELISSLGEQGERGGGTLRSPAFVLPPKLTFWMSGHNGLPSEPDRKLNFARLVLEDGTEVARSYPPREDDAHTYEWDLRSNAGERGHIEVVDGITELDGFAWLAVSAFEPSAAPLPLGVVQTEQAARIGLIDLAGQLKLEHLKGAVTALAEAKNEDPQIRLAAARALAALDSALAVPPLSELLADLQLSLTTRTAAADLLAQINSNNSRQALLTTLPAAPQALATSIAAGLASRPELAEPMLQLIEQGKASASLLVEPLVHERLKSCGLANVEARIAKLTEGLEPADAQKAELITRRRASYLAGKFDAETGRQVFAKSLCASCHRIGAAGSTIGPALDGIGNRGLDRLLEDTLDPNRNVDPAFRAVNILTDAGLVHSGFGVREEGDELVFNDSGGKQQRLPIQEVLEQSPSTLSPMPNNVADQMTEEDYYSLLAYLLSLQQLQ